MRPGSRLVLRYRLGVDDLGALCNRFRTTPGLGRDALVELALALAGRDIQTLRWALVDAGLIDLARAMPIRWPHLDAIGARFAQGKPVPDDMIAGAIAHLEGLDLDADLLRAVHAAKVLGPRLEPERRAALLAELVERATAATADGRWGIGEHSVDPALELARALAHGGDEAAVDAQLDARAARYPRFITLDELPEARAICRARGQPHRGRTWERFRRWAGDGLGGDGTPGEQVAWLVETLDEPWGDAAGRLAEAAASGRRGSSRTGQATGTRGSTPRSASCVVGRKRSPPRSPASTPRGLPAASTSPITRSGPLLFDGDEVRARL